MQQPGHVDVGDRPLLYREIALELGVQDQPFGEKPLHGVHALALQRPSGEKRRGDLPCLHLAHRQLALHAPAASPSEAHSAEQPPAECARLGFAQRELAPRHRALRQKLAETRIHADGKGEGVRGDFDRRSLPLRLQLHRKLALGVGNRNRLQRAVRRKTRIDFQRRQVQLGDIDLQSLGYYALDPERHAPALVLQQRGEKFPGEGRAFQLETLERYSVPQQGGDHRGGLDHGYAHRVLFSNHYLLELQLRERQQRQVDGADLDRLPEPRLRHLFILSGFQGHEGKRGNRHDEGQEQHHRKLLRDAARPSFRPEFPRGKRGFVGIPGLIVTPPCILSGPLFRLRRLAGLLSRLRPRLFLFADALLLLLLLGTPLLLLGALGFLPGLATGALLPLPALVLLALPVLGFASRVSSCSRSERSRASRSSVSRRSRASSSVRRRRSSSRLGRSSSSRRARSSDSRLARISPSTLARASVSIRARASASCLAFSSFTRRVLSSISLRRRSSALCFSACSASMTARATASRRAFS